MKYTYKNVPEGDIRNKKWSHIGDAKKTLSFIKKYNYDKIIYDIGANVMDHSIYLANELSNSKVIAFEPVNELFNMGVKNVKDYNIKNVQPFNYGVGNKKEKLRIENDNVGSSLLKKGNSNDFDIIQVIRIDDFVKEQKLPAPTFIKIDVEGFGLEVLKGAEKTIMKHRPAIMFEWHPHLAHISKKLLQEKLKTLTDYGYGVKKFLSDIEFILVHKDNDSNLMELKFDEMYNESMMWSLRGDYDASSSKSEMKKYVKEFKALKGNYKRTFKQKLRNKMLWSKLYRLFSSKPKS